MNEKSVIMELQRTVQTLEAKRIDGLLREAALLQERDEAQAEAEHLRYLLSETLQNCKYWSDDFKDEVRAALAATRGGK